MSPCPWSELLSIPTQTHSPPCMSLLNAELFDTFFFTRDFWLGGVSAGDERLCTVWQRGRASGSVWTDGRSLMCLMHVDYWNDKLNAYLYVHPWPCSLSVCVACRLVSACVWGQGAASHFTGCSGAAGVFIQSRPLAVEAAMGRTLALQRASLWWAVMLLAREVGVGLGEWRAWRLGNWHWTAG